MKRFFVEGGDPGFSPEKNKYIINKTIKQHEANLKRKVKEYDEELGERADAVAQYLTHLSHSHNSTTVEKYFGKKNLAALQARKIQQKLINAHNRAYKLQEIS